MKLYLVKPDLIYYEQYNEMMAEWCADGTSISPWFLGEPFVNMDEFADFVRKLDDCEKGLLDKKFAPSSSYFVVNEDGKLIGATSLRHYLTVEGYHSWGHIGSWRTAEKCGGVLENIVFEEGDDRAIRRYWIELLK